MLCIWIFTLKPLLTSFGFVEQWLRDPSMKSLIIIWKYILMMKLYLNSDWQYMHKTPIGYA